MPPDQPKRSMWPTIFALLAPVLYAASLPFAMSMRGLPLWFERILGWFYSPLIWTCRSFKPLGSILGWWLDLWGMNG